MSGTSVIKIYLFDFIDYNLRKITLNCFWTICPDDLFAYEVGRAIKYCQENVRKGHCKDFHIVAGEQ